MPWIDGVEYSMGVKTEAISAVRNAFPQGIVAGLGFCHDGVVWPASMPAALRRFPAFIRHSPTRAGRSPNDARQSYKDWLMCRHIVSIP